MQQNAENQVRIMTNHTGGKPHTIQESWQIWADVPLNPFIAAFCCREQAEPKTVRTECDTCVRNYQAVLFSVQRMQTHKEGVRGKGSPTAYF